MKNYQNHIPFHIFITILCTTNLIAGMDALKKNIMNRSIIYHKYINHFNVPQKYSFFNE
jgi:hypothetical protein